MQFRTWPLRRSVRSTEISYPIEFRNKRSCERRSNLWARVRKY